MYFNCLSAPLQWNPAPSRFHVLVLTKLRRRVLAVRSSPAPTHAEPARDQAVCGDPTQLRMCSIVCTCPLLSCGTQPPTPRRCSGSRRLAVPRACADNSTRSLGSLLASTLGNLEEALGKTRNLLTLVSYMLLEALPNIPRKPFSKPLQKPFSNLF